MKAKVLFTVILLFMPLMAGAQNASEQDSGILSSIPDIQIDSVNNSTGQASSSQSTLSWIIILGLTFLGVVLYSFDIDPKWIILLIGAAALIFLLSRLNLIPI